MTAVFESSTSRKVYVNGSYLFTATVSIPFVAANTIAIGAVMRSAAYGYITGLVDDARVYNRALSATEVSALYAYT